MASTLMMNAQAFPFFPSSSATAGSNLSSPSHHLQQQQQQHQAPSMPLSPSEAALDLSKLSLPESGAEQASSSFSGSSHPHRLPGYGYRVASPMHYPTAPFPLSHSSSSSSSAGSPYGGFSPAQRQSPYGSGGGGADEYVAELPVTPPFFLSHKRSQSQTAGLQPPLLLQQPPHRGHHISGDSYTSTASATSSPASSFPHSSPQSSPPYSPRDDLSPPQASSRYSHSQHSHPVNTDHTRRLSDAALGFSSTVIAYHTAPTPLSSSSSSFTPSGSSSPSSSSAAPPPVSSGVVDPRAYEPERLHALICVVLHMESAGSQQKFLSQLGILYKQMFPQLFVKGMLKDLVDHAVSSGLLKLTGPAGQQQVFLTTQARLAGGQMLSGGSGSQLQASLQQQQQYGAAGLQQSQSPAPSPSGTPPPGQAAPDDDDGSGQHQQRLGRPRSGSNAGIGSSRHSRSSTVQYGSSGRLTPNTSPQLAGNNAVMPLPPLSIAAAMNSGSLSLTSPALPSSSAAFYPSFSAQSSFPASVPSAAVFSPSGLEEKYFRHEKVRHLRYMFHFRVHACRAFLSKQCPAMDAGKKGSSASSSTDCFDYHSSSKMRRRVPRIVQYSNGTFWSYNACRCQAVEKEVRCEKGGELPLQPQQGGDRLPSLAVQDAALLVPGSP